MEHDVTFLFISFSSIFFERSQSDLKSSNETSLCKNSYWLWECDPRITFDLDNSIISLLLKK